MDFMKAMLLVTILTLCFTGGCLESKSTVENKGSDNGNSSAKNNTVVIPCLVYKEQGDKIVALIAHWKIDSSTMEISRDQAFYFNKNDRSESSLIIWDGADNFVLTDTCYPSDKYKSSSKLIPPIPTVFIGENIMLTKIKKPSGELDKYIVETEYSGKKIIKDIRLEMNYQDRSGKSYDLFPNDISFTCGDDSYVYFIYARPLDHEVKLISVKYNLATDEKSLSIIEADKQLNPEALFMQYSVDNIGTRFYSHTDDGLSMFDVNQNEFKYLKNLSDDCKNYIISTDNNDVCVRHLGVIGVYKDILIIFVPVYTGKTNELLYCAIKDNKIIAAIYIQDDIMQLMDANKNIKSEIDLKEMKLNSDMSLSFPGKNGINQ